MRMLKVWAAKSKHGSRLASQSLCLGRSLFLEAWLTSLMISKLFRGFWRRCIMSSGNFLSATQPGEVGRVTEKRCLPLLACRFHATGLWRREIAKPMLLSDPQGCHTAQLPPLGRANPTAEAM